MASSMPTAAVEAPAAPEPPRSATHPLAQPQPVAGPPPRPVPPPPVPPLPPVGSDLPPDAPERPRKLRGRTLDDVLSLVGAAIGSLALTWLVYGKILPFYGTLGFIIVWYVVFLLMYA